MHAFIVRPFGEKDGINFDRVEAELIRPALEESGFSGGTTGEFMQQGNIRTDMFEQLLIADLVIADISIHNANVFYELGIRHALRDKRTVLIKSKGDDVPFDLKTDRYLRYDASNPGESREDLIKALGETWNAQERDSPVFGLLPGLEPVDPAKFLLVPSDFREEVERAADAKKSAKLELLFDEIDGFAWRTMGLRLIGNAQQRLEDWQGAKSSWEAVRDYDDKDLGANLCLGTIYERLGDLSRSDRALERVLQNPNVVGPHRAEPLALMGRNAKTRWEQDWKDILDLDAAQKAALESPHLKKSFDLYRRGFIGDRNHYYSGLNALATLTVMTQLADIHPGVWADGFDWEDEAVLELKKLRTLQSDLASGVKLSIFSKRAALNSECEADIWAEISDADRIFLTSTKPSRVGRAYREALANAPTFAQETARTQLILYRTLGIFPENVQAALNNIPAVAPEEESSEEHARVILFTGHRIDVSGREVPRFPKHSEGLARSMILEAVSQENNAAEGRLCGIASGASGGDVLFHEICDDLNIPTKMCLAVPEQDYIKRSVAHAGPEWVHRFKRLAEQTAPEILSESNQLPRWLRGKPDYTIFQRCNLWMLHIALHVSAGELVVVALWNSEEGDGPGGTRDLVHRAQAHGAMVVHLDARKLTE